MLWTRTDEDNSGTCSQSRLRADVVEHGAPCISTTIDTLENDHH